MCGTALRQRAGIGAKDQRDEGVNQETFQGEKACHKPEDACQRLPIES